MRARALVCNERQEFSLREVTLPEPAADNIVVRTLYSGVSIGTEFALIRNKLSWGPYPLCTGYQAVGVVEHAGETGSGFEAGDRVYYRDNKHIRLPDGQPISAVSGTHCSRAVIAPHDTHGVALLPQGVREDVASLFVMPAVGLHGVDMANPRMGSTVVVYGAGMIGLGVVAACAHRGCVVIAVDVEPQRLNVALRLGADHVVNGASEDVQARLREVAPAGADVVFEATGIPACVDRAVALCRQRGTFVFQGNYGAEPISFRFLPAHGRELTAVFPCDDGLAPCRRAVLKNMAMGTLKWEQVITHRIEAEEAPALFERINRGRAPDVLGAVIHWSD